MSEHLGPVEHVQVGNGDCYRQFNNPVNQASSTLWIPKSGQSVQYVDADLQAWTQSAGNDSYNGWEFEGFPNEPLTDNQILTGARHYADGHLHYGWPLVMAEVVGQAGFAWHGMGGAAWGNHPDCPGDIRRPQRAAMLYIASLVLQPSSQSTPTMEEEMHAVVAQNGDIKIYTAGAGDRAGHLLEFTRHQGDQSDSVIDITAQIGGVVPFTVQP